VTQVIGGVWAQKYGGNLLFGMGVFATAILTILTPLAASWSIYAMIAVRVIIGLFEGVTYSSLFEIFSKWASNQYPSLCFSNFHPAILVAAI
jgi:MFS family permease